MALHRKGKLLAGALFAGALFGQEEEYIFSGTGRLVETEQVRPVQFITPNFAADDNQNDDDVVATTESTQAVTLEPKPSQAPAINPAQGNPELLAIQISQEITLIQQIKSDEEALLMMLLEL